LISTMSATLRSATTGLDPAGGRLDGRASRSVWAPPRREARQHDP
jgi:hypothetical protein